MGKLIGIILIYIIGISLAGFLAAGILLALFYIQKRISHMTADKWELYFNNLSNKKYYFVVLLFMQHLLFNWDVKFYTI